MRRDGATVGVQGLSTGTADQLYPALRIASVEDYLDWAAALPFVADELLINFNDERAAAGFRVAELGFLAVAFAIQARVGIGLGFVRVVAPLLAEEVRAVPTTAILRLEALLRCPRFDERAIDREVLLRQMRLRLFQHAREELAGDNFVEQTLAVLREHRVVPHRLINFQTCEPAEQ